MAHIDFKKLGEVLTAANLTGKPVNQYTKEEVEVLVQACIDSLVPDKPSFKDPYIDDGGILHIPADSDPKYHWWNKGQSIWATLRQLGASEETYKRYFDAAEAPF